MNHILKMNEMEFTQSKLTDWCAHHMSHKNHSQSSSVCAVMYVKKSKNEECHWMREEPKHIDHRTMAVKINYMEKPSQWAIKQGKLTTLSLSLLCMQKNSVIMMRAFCSDNKCIQLCMSMNNNKSQVNFFWWCDIEIWWRDKIDKSATFAVIISCNYY